MDFIEILKAAIIGVIEGITEWLPISSTGHMILADEFIKLDVSLEFWEVFLVVIQLGAILAVIVLFFNKLNPFAPSKGTSGRRRTWRLWAKVVVGCIPAAIIGILFDDWFTENFHNALTVAIALVVYGIAFIVVERVKGKKTAAEASSTKATTEVATRRAAEEAADLTTKTVTETITEAPARGKHSPAALEARAAMLGEESYTSALQASTGYSPYGLEHPLKTEDSLQSKKDKEGSFIDKVGSRPHANTQPHSDDAVATVDDLGFGRALGIGAFQVLAIVPGTSRSGATILGGRILGVSREAAAEFSFFLAIPVMFGWSLLKVVKAFVIDDLTLSSTEWAVFITGIVVAFVVSILAIKILMSYIRKHSFELFGWYRIILGIIVLIFFIVTGQLFIIQ